MTPFRLVLFLLLAPSLSMAGVVERVALASPRSQLVAAGPGRIVASDGGAFLVHAQRISREGIQLDAAPIAGAEGYAVGWRDGWLIINGRPDRLLVKHLRDSGAPELKYEIPRRRELLGAASREGKLVLLERAFEGNRSVLWVTTADEIGVLHSSRLGLLEGGTIARFEDGFLLVTHVRGTELSFQLDAWRLDSDGVPRRFAHVGEIRFGDPKLALAVNGDRALLTYFDAGTATARVIDDSLVSSAPVAISADHAASLASAFPLALGDGFLVSYGDSYQATPHVAIVIDRNGTIVSEGRADPIVAGDRHGDRYLVLRPWGDAGLAERDPRAVVAAYRLKRRVYENPRELDAVVSGEVTLVAFDRRFVRVDESGARIDPEPLAGDASIVAIPDGFAFVTHAADQFRLQRLARRGGWIDPAPLVLAPAPGVRGYAVHANDRDLLVAWATAGEILWMRFGFDGSPIDATPRRVDRSRPSDIAVRFGVSGRGGERLLLLQETFVCYITCVQPELRLESLALDRDARPLAPPSIIASASSDARGVGLADGTWVVPRAGELLHLTREGGLLSRGKQPLLDGPLLDFAPTPLGWKAIGGDPLRAVEITGVDSVRRVTGLSAMSFARFAAGERLAFLAEAPGVENATVPWIGRLRARDGDLSIALRRLPPGAGAIEVQVAVHNKGGETATSVYVTGWGVTERLGSIAPGTTHYLTMRAGSPDAAIVVLSDDVADVDFANNAALVGGAGNAPRRSRSARR